MGPGSGPGQEIPGPDVCLGFSDIADVDDHGISRPTQ